MINIKIPKKIKVGGYDYKIEISESHDKELQCNGNYGECCSHPMRRIRIRSNIIPQQFSVTFLHELSHVVDMIYSNDSMTEEQVAAQANGFLQVFEQMGLRFVRS